MLFLVTMYKLCSACVKQNRTAINDCSLLAKQTFSDLVGKRASSLFINFEQVIKPFLVSVVDWTFYKSTIKCNWILLLCHVRVRSSHRSCSVKKVLLEISQNSQEKTCARVSFLIKLQASGNFIKKETLARVFSCEFCEIYQTTFLTEHLRWLLLAFRVNLHSVILELLARNRCSIWRLGEQ